MIEIKKIYAAHFLAGCSTIASVTYTLYFLSHGLSQSQIGQLFAVFMISLAILDIPTGGLSDMFGHKASVVVGLFFHALGSLFFFLFPTLSGFYLGMILSALGLALQSGAWSSLMYEILDQNGVKESYQKVSGRANAYFLAGAVIASPIGAVLYKLNPPLPYFLAAFFIFLACVVAFLVKWQFQPKTPSFTSYWQNTKKGVSLTLANRTLVALTVIGLTLTLSRLVMNQNLSQPYQLSIGIDVAFIGVVAALVAGIQSVISAFAHRITEKIGTTLSLLMIVALPSISLLIMSYFHSTWMLGFLFVFAAAQAYRDPFLGSITQKEMRSEVRSTMTSTVSFFTTITVGLLLPLWGLSIDSFGMRSTMQYLALCVFAVGIAGMFFYLRIHQSKTKSFGV